MTRIPKELEKEIRKLFKDQQVSRPLVEARYLLGTLNEALAELGMKIVLEKYEPKGEQA